MMFGEVTIGWQDGYAALNAITLMMNVGIIQWIVIYWIQKVQSGISLML